MQHVDRRDFIKIMAGSIGGVILTTCFGCGGSSNIPNGYRFFRIKTTGEATAGGFSIDRFSGTAHISSNGILTFNAQNTGNQSGIFQVAVDFAKRIPGIEWERSVLLEGETLTDDRVVSRFQAMDVNDDGNIAAVLVADGSNPNTHYGAGLYLDADRRGFEPVMIAGTTFEGGDLYSTGILGDVDLHDDNEMIVVAHHAPNGAGSMPGQGLLHLPGSSLAASRMIMSTGDALSTTDHTITDFGLVDLHDNGHFAVQASTSSIETLTKGSGGASEPSGKTILTSTLQAPADHLLLTSCPVINAGTHLSDASYGSRMGADGKAATIISLPGEKPSLILDDQVLLRVGDPSPAGGVIIGFGPGAFGADGVFFYTLFSNNYAGMALVAFNGREHHVILSRGETLSDGGMPVETILFGTTTKHVDAQQRIVLLCEFTDGTMSLVAGIPS